MPRLLFETPLPCSPERLWEFHSSADALALLTPPSRKVEVLGGDLQVRQGALHVIRVRQFGVPIVWHARIVECEPPARFVDVAERSPFAFWRHEHAFLPHPGGSLLRDTVEYRLPFGPLGAIADRAFVRRDLERLFAFRHAATLEWATNSSK